MVVFVPTFINIILNIRIFLHVRNSTRRVQPQLPSTSTNGNNNNQNARISPREIALLKKCFLCFLCLLEVGVLFILLQLLLGKATPRELFINVRYYYV